MNNEQISKKEIINKISHESGIDFEQTKTIIDTYHSMIIEGLKIGIEFNFKEFGKYFPRISKPKKGRDITRNVVIDIPEKVRYNWKPSKMLYR